MIIFISCQDEIIESENNCSGQWLTSNSINGEWELYKQEYTNYHWDNWSESDTIFIQTFDYQLNIGLDSTQMFEILWNYNNYSWYFFGNWNFIDNCGNLNWNFIEYPNTYINEFYSLPKITHAEIYRAIYPDPDTLYMFWEKNFIENFYGINYLTKK